MNMLETYNLNSSAYYSHLSESYDLAQAAQAAAQAAQAAAAQASSGTKLDPLAPAVTGAGVSESPTSVGQTAGDQTGGDNSVIPKLEFEKGEVQVKMFKLEFEVISRFFNFAQSDSVLDINFFTYFQFRIS